MSHLTVHVSVISNKLNRFFNKCCVVPKDFHTHPKEGYWKFLGGGGRGERVKKPNVLKESVNQEC